MTANDPKTLLKCTILNRFGSCDQRPNGKYRLQDWKESVLGCWKNMFTDSEANQLMKANYNNGWNVPKV